MNIKEWCESHDPTLGPTKMRERMLGKYGKAPSKQSLSKVLKGERTPTLELAIMLNEVTGNLVSIGSMIVEKLYLPEPDVDDELDGLDFTSEVDEDDPFAGL